MGRPKLEVDIDVDIFDSYYWYKEELIDFAGQLGLSTGGGKFEIHDRISKFLRTGEKEMPRKKGSLSNFDWGTEPLSRRTVITDNYRNTQNVRHFFKTTLGEGFSFSISFMDWMKEHIGWTLGDVIDNYDEIKNLRKNQAIPDHNQFNLYLREFMEDNPGASKAEATAVWKKLIEIPRPGSKGRGIRYSREDLDL